MEIELSHVIGGIALLISLLSNLFLFVKKHGEQLAVLNRLDKSFDAVQFSIQEIIKVNVELKTIIRDHERRLTQIENFRYEELKKESRS